MADQTPHDLTAIQARADKAATALEMWRDNSPFRAAVVAASAEDVPALLAEIQRLRALVGGEGQPGWDNIDRAEAIRQAEESHADRLQWIQRFDALRDQRDAEIERLQEELDGAHNSAWEMREHLKASREQGDQLRDQVAQLRAELDEYPARIGDAWAYGDELERQRDQVLALLDVTEERGMPGECWVIAKKIRAVYARQGGEQP